MNFDRIIRILFAGAVAFALIASCAVRVHAATTDGAPCIRKPAGHHHTNKSKPEPAQTCVAPKAPPPCIGLVPVDELNEIPLPRTYPVYVYPLSDIPTTAGNDAGGDSGGGFWDTVGGWFGGGVVASPGGNSGHGGGYTGNPGGGFRMAAPELDPKGFSAGVIVFAIGLTIIGGRK